MLGVWELGNGCTIAVAAHNRHLRPNKELDRGRNDKRFGCFELSSSFHRTKAIEIST